jgi:creatinine amidohydrolase
MSDTENDEYQYERLSWPEIDAAAEAGKMIVVPVGSTEDHGPHMPVDVDQVLPESICEAAVVDRNDALLFPTVTHGYLPHHMDYPGGITIRWDTFVNHLIDIGVSLAHHGFRKILFVNGHGSNHHLLEQATRQVCLQYPDVHCAMISWFFIEEVQETLLDIREAGPQGIGHAGEMETSMYLHLDPDKIDMDQAVEDINMPDNRYFHNVDFAGENRDEDSTAVTMMPWWSTFSETGVLGDATAASAEKGELLFEAAVKGLDNVLEGLRQYPHREINDKHTREVADREYDPFRPR